VIDASRPNNMSALVYTYTELDAVLSEKRASDRKPSRDLPESPGVKTGPVLVSGLEFEYLL
jgi:hypothetical protein